MILCADDTGMAALDEESVFNLAKELQDEGFDPEMEGDFAKCLGIRVQENDNGTICMTQKGMIDKIIATAKMEECNPNGKSALTTALGLDAKGKP